MKVALVIVGVVVAVLAILLTVVVVIGSRLPRQHTASRWIQLGRPPSEVYATIHDFAASPQWRTGVRSVEMLGVVDGHIQFRERGSNGGVTYEVLEDVPDRRIVTRIVDHDLGYGGSWQYELSPSGEGMRLQITENGEVSNPLFRFMSLYVFGHTTNMDAYLKALARHFGESATPQN